MQVVSGRPGTIREVRWLLSSRENNGGVAVVPSFEKFLIGAVPFAELLS
jgi:hypothetical protein